MASYTPHTLFTLTIPSIVVAFTVLWYFRKRRNSEATCDCSQSSEEYSNYSQQSHPVVVSMNLQKVKGALLASNSVCLVKNTSSDMQLKEDSRSGSECSDKQPQVNGKHVSVEKSKVHVNGTTCSSVTMRQDNVANAVSFSSGCDKIIDNGSTCPEPCSVTKMNDSSKLNGNAELHLANGVQSINLDGENGQVKHLPCNGNNGIANGHCSDYSCSANSHDSSPAELKTQTLVDMPSEDDKFDSYSLQVQVGSPCTSVTEELTCETDFVPNASTSDSSLSAEQDSNPACSPLSVPSSDEASGESLKSPITNVEDGGRDCGECSDASVSNKGADNRLILTGEEGEEIVEGAIARELHEFEIPQELCGLLIGRNGRFVKQIKEKSNADILIRNHPVFQNMKACVVSGQSSEITDALSLIRERFPLEKYPNLLLTNIADVQPEYQLPITVKLSLPHGVPFDVILTSVVNPGYFFVHQPIHPTYHTLSYISNSMSDLYSNYETPKVYRYSVGYVVAAPIANGWYRCEIMEINEENRTAVVKLLDFGGFSTVSLDDLRQLNYQFSAFPFQAAECFLGGVTYPEGQEGWSDEAKSVFEELAHGQIIHGYIVDYDRESGIPYVHLYKIQGAQHIFINNELVRRGLARWTIPIPQDCTSREQ